MTLETEQSEIVLVIPKAKAVPSKEVLAFSQRIIKSISKEIKKDGTKTEKLDSIVKGLEDVFFTGGFSRETTPVDTYVVNELDQVIIATNSSLSIVKELTDRYKKHSLTYNEAIVRYQEAVLGCSNERLILLKRDSADLNQLISFLPTETIREHVNNILNSYDRYITQNMCDNIKAYFSGSLDDINGKLLKWLKGDVIDFDGNEVSGDDGKALLVTHQEKPIEVKEDVLEKTEDTQNTKVVSKKAEEELEVKEKTTDSKEKPEEVEEETDQTKESDKNKEESKPKKTRKPRTKRTTKKTTDKEKEEA